jgi:hypothetical protein
VEKDMLNPKKEGEENLVSTRCRAELKFELLQKHTNVKINTRVVRITS